MKNFKKITYCIVGILLVLIPFTVFAQQEGTIVFDYFGLSQAGFSSSNPAEIIGAIVAMVLTFVGLIFLILLISAGFILAFAGGNEEKVTKARKIIVTAVVGLIVTLAAYGLAYLIFAQLPGGSGGGGDCTCRSTCKSEEQSFGQKDCQTGQVCCGMGGNDCEDKGGNCYSKCQITGGTCVEDGGTCGDGDEIFVGTGCPSGTFCCSPDYRINPPCEMIDQSLEADAFEGCGTGFRCCVPKNN